MPIDESRAFIPVNIAIMTVSDTRTRSDDTSGDVLEARIQEAGHKLAARIIVPDDKDRITAQLNMWIADSPCARYVCAPTLSELPPILIV